MRETIRLDKMTFDVTDVMVVLGVGAILGGLMGMAGIVIGALCAIGGWAMMKFKKKEVKKDAS